MRKKKSRRETLSDAPKPHSAELRGAIVGIGASAGGLDAFKKFLSAMPPDSGVAFVLIPHLDPRHESLMVKLLSPVREAQEDMSIEPNSVYVIPPNQNLAVRDGVLHLSNPPAPRGLQTAIDFFFPSLAVDQKERPLACR